MSVFTIPAKVPLYLANHWVIDVGGRRWDALKLAGQAVVDWDDWLTDHSVPLPAWDLSVGDLAQPRSCRYGLLTASFQYRRACARWKRSRQRCCISGTETARIAV
jgi:hypothetical protein